MSPSTTTLASSKRSDRYLTAATHEAQRSAQRFRHGAIIVKGGKILSAGHNSIRTGFAGPLAEAHTSSAEGRAAGGGGGGKMNEAFSMHAEMAAISNALRGARPAAFKSNFDIHRHEALASTTTTTPQQALFDATLLASYLSLKDLARREQLQQPRHSLLLANTNAAPSSAHSDVSSSDDASSTSNSDSRRTNHTPSSHHDTLRNRTPNANSNSGSTALRSSLPNWAPTSASASVAASASASGSSSIASSDETDDSPYESDHRCFAPHRSSHPRTAAHAASHGERTNARSTSREKEQTAPSTRLNGADIYVVRLQQDSSSRATLRRSKRRAQACASAASAGAGVDGRCVEGRDGSSGGAQEEAGVEEGVKYADSRPCWRCVQWCHWAGIKRAFWTNNEGAWEGGKIADLIDPACTDVFVTKSERRSLALSGAGAAA